MIGLPCLRGRSVVKHKKSSIYQLTVCALMAAVMCVLGPMSIPIGAVPISFTNLVIYLAVCLLGMKWGTVSLVVYLLLGTCGLPVFSSYTGGLGKLAGPTGGYLVGFIFLALISGLFLERSHNHIGWTILGMILGTAVAYAFGTAWFIIQMKCGLWYALTICVFPFLVFDLIKIVAATLVGGTIRRQLIRAHLVEDRFGEIVK